MEYQFNDLQEKLLSIAEKFGGNRHSLFSAITYLAYPQSTVEDFFEFLEKNNDRRNRNFYAMQIESLRSLTEDEKRALNFLGKYVSDFQPLYKEQPFEEWLPEGRQVLRARDILF